MSTPPESRKAPFITGKVDERKGRLLTEIHGDVTSTHTPEFRRGMAAIIEQYDETLWQSLYLDMRSARILDCMGLNWVYAETIRLKDSGKNMVIRISSPAINRIMRFAGMDKLALIKYRRRKQTR